MTALLEAAGISQALLAAPESRVHAEQMTRLIQGIWDTLEDEFMGCTPRPCKPGAFAMMCQLVSHCDSVDALFGQGIKFYGLITDDIRMQYRHVDGGREFVVTMADPARDREHFYLEFWLVIWHRLASWMAGKKIKLQSAHFSYSRPAHIGEFRHQFACACHFDQPETKLCFSQQYAGMPLVRTQHELARFLRNSPADLMTIPGDDDSFSLRIKTLLSNDSGTVLHLPTFEQLAETMCVSPQTLRRKLKDEGTSYQKIKDALRCDIAIEKIATQNMAVGDVAAILGFAEPRSFTRAFKQWTSVSPKAYRRKPRVENRPILTQGTELYGPEKPLFEKT